jgi:MFS family permease
MRKWLPMLILASAQFVMVLDSSVMNVAISQIVDDLDTTIQGVQTAITLYTLVMAAFMLLGAKLGDILGRNWAFAIGLAIYGVGSLTTALSPNLAVLLVGWSGVEGFGAVLVVPAIAALTAANYEGGDRALAYALLGGIAAIAVAAGPLIGGWVTTQFTWRYVFAAETVVVILILLLRGQIAHAPGPARRPQLDVVGVALSSAGLGLVVLAILRSSVWGFVKPRTPPTISGTEITPLGFSVVPFLVLGGLALLWAFVAWEQRRARRGRDELLDTGLLAISQLRAGLSTLVGQQFVLMGTFFVIPVYLQVVLGLDAFETGKRLLPLSAAMLVFAMLGPRIAGRRSPRVVAQIGLVAVSIGALVMLGTLDVKLRDTGFKLALALIGAGAGLLASQLGNIIMSAVAPTKTSEAGGLQGTARTSGPRSARRSSARCCSGPCRPASASASPTTPTSRRPRARRSSPTPSRGSTSCPSRRPSRQPSTVGSPPTRRAPSPPTTVTRSSTRCGCRSARSRSRRCCRSGSRGGCRPGRSPKMRSAPPSRRPSPRPGDAHMPPEGWCPRDQTWGRPGAAATPRCSSSTTSPSSAPRRATSRLKRPPRRSPQGRPLSGMVPAMRVPRPVRDSTRSVPPTAMRRSWMLVRP